MKHRSFAAVFALALLALLLAAGVQAEPVVPTDRAPVSAPSPDQTLIDPTGCVDSSSTWLGKGQTISTNSGNHWAGVIFVHIPPTDPAKIPTFCTDLGTSIGQGQCFVAAGPTACPVTWLLNNGYGPNDAATEL